MQSDKFDPNLSFIQTCVSRNIYVDVIAYSMFLASFSRMSYIYMYTFSSVCGFPGNQTHDLTIASAIRYYLSYMEMVTQMPQMCSDSH